MLPSEHIPPQKGRREFKLPVIQIPKYGKYQAGDANSQTRPSASSRPRVGHCNSIVSLFQEITAITAASAAPNNLPVFLKLSNTLTRFPLELAIRAVYNSSAHGINVVRSWSASGFSISNVSIGLNVRVAKIARRLHNTLATSVRR